MSIHEFGSGVHVLKNFFFCQHLCQDTFDGLLLVKIFYFFYIQKKKKKKSKKKKTKKTKQTGKGWAPALATSMHNL